MAGKGKTTITTQGVLYINGKPAENSMESIRSITRKLRRDLQKLPQDSDKFNKKAQELTRAEKRFTKMNDKIRETRAHLKESGREVKSFNDLFFQLATNAKRRFAEAGGGAKGFGKTIKVVAAESWAAISSIPLVGWAAGVVGLFALGAREITKYNNEVIEETSRLENLFGGDFLGIESLRIKIKALSKTFGVSFDQISKTVNKLYDSGLADTEEAIEAIKIGLATAPDESAFLSQLESGADRAKQIGISLQEVISLNQAAQSSFMGVDQVYRRLERSNMRFQKGLEGNKALIEAFGETFSKDIIKSVNEGQLTTIEALEKVRQKTEETGLSAQQQAKLSSDFFGSRAANAASYNEILGLINEASKEQIDQMTDLQKQSIELADLYERQGVAMSKALNSDDVKRLQFEFRKLWTETKIDFYDFVSRLKKGAEEIRARWEYVIGYIQGRQKHSHKEAKSYAKFRSNLYRGERERQNKAFAEAEKLIQEREEKEKEAAKKRASGSGNNYDAEAKKREKELADIQKAEEEAYKKRLDLLSKFDAAKAALIEDDVERQKALEENRRAQELRDYTQQISELSKQRAEARTLAEIENLEASMKLLAETEELNAQAHHNKLLAIQEEADAKLFEAKVKAEQKQLELDRAKDEEEILAITSLNEAKRALQDQHYLQLTDQELKAIRTLEDAKAALREAADRKALQAQLQALTEQRKMLEDQLKGLTGSAAEELKENLDDLYIKIAQLKSAIQGGQDEDQASAADERDQELSQVDVLGFSALQWKEMFDNLDTTKGKLEAVGAVFQAMGNAGQMYSDLISNLNEKEFAQFSAIQDKKKQELKRQLDAGFLSNEEYQQKIQKVEAETANKKAEMDYKQAKADKVARMFSIAGETAVAIATALPNLVLAGIVGALGAVQLGTVAAQPLPEKAKFAWGGFTGSGFGRPDETGFKPAGVVHEDEWVAPKWMTEEPRTARIIDYLEAVRQTGLPAMAEGGRTRRSSESSSRSETNESPIPFSSDELVAVLHRLEDLLIVLDENGITAFISEDAKNARKMLKMIKSYEKLESKNKH